MEKSTKMAASIHRNRLSDHPGQGIAQTHHLGLHRGPKSNTIQSNSMESYQRYILRHLKQYSSIQCTE
jgi:hypothetical protein